MPNAHILNLKGFEFSFKGKDGRPSEMPRETPSSNGGENPAPATEGWTVPIGPRVFLGQHAVERIAHRP